MFSIKKKVFVGVSIAGLFLLYAFYHFVGNKAPVELIYDQERVLRFSYELTNTTNRAIQDAKFSVYLPVSLMANQQVAKIDASEEYELEQSAVGNNVAHFNVGLIPPFGKKKITLTSVLNVAAKPNAVPISKDIDYLNEEKYIEFNNERISSLASTLRGVTDFESIENIYKWVSSRIKNSGYTSEDKGALYALESLKGDCTEHMYLVIALARSLGVPARGIGGYVYNSNMVAKPADYHNWAEVKIDGLWQIIDTQKKSFMENVGSYLAIRVISSDETSILGNSHRFLTAGENIKVVM